MPYVNPSARFTYVLPDDSQSAQVFLNDGIASYLYAEDSAGVRTIAAQVKGEDNGTQSVQVRLSSAVNVTVLDESGNQVYP